MKNASGASRNAIDAEGGKRMIPDIAEQKHTAGVLQSNLKVRSQTQNCDVGVDDLESSIGYLCSTAAVHGMMVV